MAGGGEFSRTVGRILKRGLFWLTGSAQGNVTPIMAILLVPLIGAFGLATETSTWFMAHRSMQHAADSAAMAAAISSVVTADADYDEAAEVSAQHGYGISSPNVTVLTERAQTCPAPNNAFSDCYRVTITKNFPLSLTRLVGYQGDIPFGSGRAETVQAVAMARPSGGSDELCFIGLTTTGNALTSNGGGNSVNWNGCSVFGNSTLRCNGATSDLGMAAGVSAGASNCGAPQISNQPVMADPYAFLAAHIPPDPCGSSYAASTYSGTVSATSISKCGTVTLNGNLTFTSPNTILTIYNGDLNLAGYTLSTAPNASLTIIFSGPVGISAKTIKGTGTVDYAAPNSGPISGIGWIQDPLIQGGNMTFNGNSPNIKITGLVYMPKTNVTLSGTIHFQTGGFACFGLVANNLTLNGNITIIDGANTQCAQAGVALPTVPGSQSRAMLVQ